MFCVKTAGTDILLKYPQHDLFVSCGLCLRQHLFKQRSAISSAPVVRQAMDADQFCPALGLLIPARPPKRHCVGCIVQKQQPALYQTGCQDLRIHRLVFCKGGQLVQRILRQDPPEGGPPGLSLDMGTKGRILLLCPGTGSVQENILRLSLSIVPYGLFPHFAHFLCGLSCHSSK